jgi:hypothetical protein
MTRQTTLQEAAASPGERRFSAPRGSLGRGRLELPRGAARLTVRGAGMPELFRARFRRPIPAVSVDGGTVTIRYPRFPARGWLRPWRRRGGQVTLNHDVAWAIAVRRGVAHLDADLRDLELTSLEVRHGASRVELRLPRPAGVVPVRIGGGANRVRIVRPAGTPARLRVARGVADLTFDGQEFGAVGGRLRLESREADGAEGRYEIEVSGGAAHVEIVTEGASA